VLAFSASVMLDALVEVLDRSPSGAPEATA
jgi:hypothetical protein